MASFNRVIMIGNLTRDPDYKQLSSGQAVCRLGLASNRQFKNRQTGQSTQEVCFIDVDVWGAQADSCKQHLQKGRLILVEGRLKLDSWEDEQGQRKSKHSIVADRVTFLSQSQGEDADEESMEASPSMASSSQQKVMPKVRPAAGPKKPKAGPTPLGPSGEISYSDQKPFEDDLPF